MVIEEEEEMAAEESESHDGHDHDWVAEVDAANQDEDYDQV